MATAIFLEAILLFLCKNGIAVFLIIGFLICDFFLTMGKIPLSISFLALFSSSQFTPADYLCHQFFVGIIL